MEGLNLTRKNAPRITQWLKNNPNTVNKAAKELNKNKTLKPNQFKPADKTIRKQDKDLFVGTGTKVRKEPDITGVYTTGPKKGQKFTIPGRFRPQNLKRRLTNKEKEDIARKVSDILKDLGKKKKSSGGGTSGGGQGGKPPPPPGNVSSGSGTPKKFQGGGKDVKNTKKTIDKVNKRIDQINKSKDKSFVDKLIGGIKNFFGFGVSNPTNISGDNQKVDTDKTKTDKITKDKTTTTDKIKTDKITKDKTTTTDKTKTDKITKDRTSTDTKQGSTTTVKPDNKTDTKTDTTIPIITKPKSTQKVDVKILPKLDQKSLLKPKKDLDPKFRQDQKNIQRQNQKQNQRQKNNNINLRPRFIPTPPLYRPYDPKRDDDIIYKGKGPPKKILNLKQKKQDAEFFKQFKVD